MTGRQFPLITLGLVCLVTGLTLDDNTPAHSPWRVVSMLFGSLGFLLVFLGERRLRR